MILVVVRFYNYLLIRSLPFGDTIAKQSGNRLFFSSVTHEGIENSRGNPFTQVNLFTTTLQTYYALPQTALLMKLPYILNSFHKKKQM